MGYTPPQPDDIYLHIDAVDFRKSINGLLNIVETELELDAFTGTLFIFIDKNQDKSKLLYWEATGLALLHKRLEKHKFKQPKLNDLNHIRLSEQQLNWLLGGYPL
ncbi:IS66 family insertion sequence element accessory protein TnpB [Brumicola nitratireducens]|uniref:IS66 Orf2 family protein n=1 Tax=Glaciecola nitratireducens (strain JCM 12485 / KCTC 12276 / FR1064) TaxID=1085623 RepID=G4QM72_GLANF|nr:IS66 family insertion sequence element accessory protein TnpB [Glaciecola nitratireducens]AEP30643.1 IS66 Orf2 family protein [Glaciecola nitratireducens FR1064]